MEISEMFKEAKIKLLQRDYLLEGICFICNDGKVNKIEIEIEK